MSGSGTAIHAGTLLVGNGDVEEDVSVGVRDGAIREVAASLDGDYGTAVDATDRVVTPGLIDAHVHLVYSGDPEAIDNRDLSDEYLSLRGAELARDALRAGVTTLGDMGARRNTVVGLRDAIADGVTLGPRIRACGNMVAITGGRATGGEPGGNIVEADGPDGVREAVRRLLMYKGADVIKLAATGALSSPHTGARDPQFTAAEMRAAVEEAHACGRPVHAHCYGERGITNALDAGVDVIVHGQTLTDEHVATMREEGTMLAPTLSAFEAMPDDEAEDPFVAGEAERDRPESSAGIAEAAEPTFRTALENDIPIAMGTDAGMPGVFYGENPEDLAYMVEYGMDEGEALVAGTRNAARSLRADGALGTVEPGKHADLLVLSGNPLDDIGVLAGGEGIDRIMLGGEFVEDRL